MFNLTLQPVKTCQNVTKPYLHLVSNVDFNLDSRVSPGRGETWKQGCVDFREKNLIRGGNWSHETICFHTPSNRPFPSCCEPHYESEAKCKTFHSKISFVCIWMKINFHNKNFALSLAFIMRLKATRKCSIAPTIGLRGDWIQAKSATLFRRHSNVTYVLHTAKIINGVKVSCDNGRCKM